MIFKVIFDDGSTETVHASNSAQAKLYTIGHFADRILVRIEPAGLSDMLRRRPAADDDCLDIEPPAAMVR